MNLLDYIKGLRKGKDAHRLEREAMKDPFLSDALEGYNAVPGNHVDRIKQMQKQIVHKVHSRSNQWKMWSIAASILICISIGGYFLLEQQRKTDLYSASFNEDKKTEPSLQEIPKAKQETTKPDLLSEQSELTAQKSEENKTAKKSETLIQEEYSKDKNTTADMDLAKQDTFLMAELPINKEIASTSKLSIDKRLGSVKLNQQMEIPQEKLIGTVAGISAQSGTKIIRGKIIDEEGNPLIGASIMQKGTHLGTVSDMSGEFSLKINSNNSIVASYIGFDPKELPIDTSASMLIAMNEDKKQLDEVVVVAYSRTKKSEKKTQKSQPIIGEKAYEDYLKSNLIRPTDSLCKDKKGTVILSFYVDYQGKPTDIQINKSVCPSIDQEAIRLLKDGCTWASGIGKVEVKIEFK